MDVADGTSRLCDALYGEQRISSVLGGSEARMLHDAADEIGKLRAKLAKVTAERDDESRLKYEARREAEAWRDGHMAILRKVTGESDAMSPLPWERATPTEGETK